MSNLIFYLNGYALPAGDVTKWPMLSEEISYDSSFNVPDGGSIEINNTDPRKYDPKYSGSLLYGTKVLKLPVSIYDPDISQTTMRGVIKNVSTESGNGKMVIEYTSQLSAIAENDCEIITTGKTPADIIYKMLTSPITKGSTTPLIDPSYIDQSSYRFSFGHQKSSRCTANATVYKGGDDSKKYGDLIPEICKIGHMALFSHYDRIYFWQYTDNKTPSIIIDKVNAGSYRDTYSQDEAFKIKNSYSIAYFNGASVAYETGKDDDSIKEYGESIFGVPSDDVGSDSSSDFNVGIDNVIGARWCGQTAISRLYKPAFMCEFEKPYAWNQIKIGDILGLNFDSFYGYNTPVRVLSVDYDRDGNKIHFKCLFL
jgi:hypothetical protein